MLSSYKFIQKFWLLNEQICEIDKLKLISDKKELDIFTNLTIKKINQALDKFRYNVIIATFHEIYAFYKKIVDDKKNYKNLKNNFEKILITMMPVIPHITNECLEKLNYNKKIQWPNIEEKYLNDDRVEIIIQINGKKRSSISTLKNIDEKKLNDLIIKEELVNKYLNNGQIIKTIYVKNRVINYIIKA